MTSRDTILNTIAINQPDLVQLPDIDINTVISYDDNYAQFKIILEGIGGEVVLIQDISS